MEVTLPEILFFALPIALVVGRKYAYSSNWEALENSRCRQRCVNKQLQHQCDKIVGFDHQVGGHRNEIILSLEGLILKPMIKEPYFMRELNLYEKMFDKKRPLLPSLRTFMPLYHGLVEHLDKPYIVLTDQTVHCRKPSTCDIKMGTQTFEPSVTLQKKLKEEGKYAYQRAIGFRIIGYKTYDIVNDTYFHVGKEFGRNLHPDNVDEGIARYFQNGKVLRRDVVMVVIEKLERMLQWMKQQNEYHFYGASLLIVYDGAVEELSDPRQVKVNLIDFAHTVESDGTVDSKFIFGLRNLILALHRIIHAYS